MKKILIAIASVAVMTSTLAFTTLKKGNGDVNLNADTKNSKVEWSGSKKSGYHPGYFLLKSGNVVLTDGKISGGKFVIDVASIKVTDFAGEKLEGHLKAPDFFDAAKFPEASLEIKSVKYSDAATAQITADLTIKGITNSVSFDAKVREASAEKFFAEAYFSIDRTKFGITYGGSNLASDVQIGVHLFAAK